MTWTIDDDEELIFNSEQYERFNSEAISIFQFLYQPSVKEKLSPKESRGNKAYFLAATWLLPYQSESRIKTDYGISRIILKWRRLVA